MQLRKVQYRLYPTSAQSAALDQACDLHRALYNAALEERISAWRHGKVRIGLNDQSASLTAIRQEDPAYAALPRKALVNTLERLDLAFKAFFRRCKNGEAPGFPRFKSRDRFKGFGFRVHGDGATFESSKRLGRDKSGQTRLLDRHGKLRVKGIPGLIAARGKPRDMGEVKTLELSRRAGKWFLTLTVDCVPDRVCGDGVAAFDWGVNRLVSGVMTSGVTTETTYFALENDRIGQKNSKKVKALQRCLARRKRGSKRRRIVKARLARARLAEANRRKDRAHKFSAQIVAANKVIAFERLTIGAMTASGSGTVEKPGKNVRQKAGLNREILDTAPGQLLSMIRTKAESAGAWIMQAPTRRIKPSQTCPACLAQVKKPLKQRLHSCPCGHVEDRDFAAARVVLNWALQELKNCPLPADATHPPGEDTALERDWRGDLASAGSENRETTPLCEA
jgi:putative transposase